MTGPTETQCPKCLIRFWDSSFPEAHTLSDYLTFGGLSNCLIATVSPVTAMARHLAIRLVGIGVPRRADRRINIAIWRKNADAMARSALRRSNVAEEARL